MKKIDNKAYILKQIENSVNTEVQRIEKEFDEELGSFKTEEEKRLNKEITKIKEENKKEIEKIEKHMNSSFELQTKKKLLDKQSELYRKVIEELKNTLAKGGKEADAVFDSMAALVEEQASSDIIDFRVPKGIKLAKRKSSDVLKELKVVAVTKIDEEYEITIDDLLKEKNVEIYNIISKSLW